MNRTSQLVALALSTVLGSFLSQSVAADVSTVYGTRTPLIEISAVSFRTPAEPGVVAAMHGCHGLATLESSSAYGKTPNWKKSAKASLLRQAKRIGATPVVWGSFTPVGAFNGRTTAHAYTC